MLTKTQSKIVQLFVSKITGKFTINAVAKKLHMNVSLAHRAITPLITEKIIQLDEQQLLSINYQKNHSELAYAEYLRAIQFLQKHKVIKEFTTEVLDKFDTEYFILLIFGSAVESDTPRDYDILCIFENYDKVKKREKALEIIASNHNAEFDITTISVESIQEMANKRTQKNVFNELLNKHIILYGGESFYRLLKHVRQ